MTNLPDDYLGNASLDDIPKSVMPRLQDEPLLAYEVFSLWCDAGYSRKPAWKAVQQYLQDKRGRWIELEELKTWPEKYQWEQRWDDANQKLTKAVNRNFKYSLEAQEADRQRQIAKRREKVRKALTKLDERIPQDIPKLEPNEAAKFYVSLSRLDIDLNKDQREESGKVNPQMTINVDMLLDRKGEIDGKTPEFMQKVKQLALKDALAIDRGEG